MTTAGIERLRTNWSFSLLLLAILLISLSTILGLLYYGAYQVDMLARTNMRERVDVAMEVESSRLKELLAEHTFWDAAYRRLVEQSDDKWAEVTFGRYLHDELGIGITLIVDGDDRPRLGYLEGEPIKLQSGKLLAPELKAMMSLVRKEMNAHTPASHFIAMHGGIYLIAVDSFTPEAQGSGVADGSLLLIGRRIDETWVESIGRLYRLQDLTIALHPDALPPDLRMPLRGDSGETLATLTWRDQVPATSMQRRLWPVLGVVSLVMSLLLLWVVHAEIDRHRQEEALLNRAANLDYLTGVSNRRDFFHRARQEFARAEREGNRLGLLLIDVDHFKRINDTLGHAVGDETLIWLTRCFNRLLRDFDILARYGGEEFTIVLPGASLRDAISSAERLRRYVETNQPGMLLDRILCTISIGVVVRREREGIEAMLSRADNALYKAKSSGRNCVVGVD